MLGGAPHILDVCYDPSSQREETTIKFINTTPEEVRLGSYLYSHGNERFPLAIVLKRELTWKNKRMIEIGLSPKQLGRYAGVGITNDLDYIPMLPDEPITVLPAREVPLDMLQRETKFRCTFAGGS